jgi:hypothetical protein
VQCYLSKNMPKYMVDFVHFSMQRLGLDKLRGEVHIALKGTLDGESYGLCWGDRREAEIQIASKQWGTPVSREDKLKSIAHELTHAHQYLTGRLKCDLASDEYNSTWLGEQYRYRPEAEIRLPWEVEAVENERDIYNEWVNQV